MIDGCKLSAMNGHVMLAALLLAGTALTGCTSDDRASGCTPPANEEALLDAYAKEPVLGVQPSGSKRREPPMRTTACRKVGKDVSTTYMGVQWDLSRNVEEREILSLYQPVTSGAGWTVVEDRAGPQFAQFCKTVLGQRSILEIGWQDAIQLERGERVPGVVSVGLRIAGEADGTCPQT